MLRIANEAWRKNASSVTSRSSGSHGCGVDLSSQEIAVKDTSVDDRELALLISSNDTYSFKSSSEVGLVHQVTSNTEGSSEILASSRHGQQRVPSVTHKQTLSSTELSYRSKDHHSTAATPLFVNNNTSQDNKGIQLLALRESILKKNLDKSTSKLSSNDMDLIEFQTDIIHRSEKPTFVSASIVSDPEAATTLHMKITDSHSSNRIIANGNEANDTFSSEPNDATQIKTPQRNSSSVFRLLNFASAYFWVGPLVTVYWCNSWHIPENYLFPTNPVTSAWISGAVGYTIFFLGYFLQDVMSDVAVRQKNSIVQCAIVQAYTYAMCWGNVNQWRCVWVLLDEYTGAYLLNAALTCSLSSVLLLLLRAHRTIASAPSTVRMDLPVKEHFKMNTYFEIQSGLRFKAADSVFTVLVIDTVGIAVWRGLWEVMDFTLTPDDKTMSGVWSLVISYGLAITLFLSQDYVTRMSLALEGQHWIVSLIFEDFITILHSVVTINHWRGLWTLMDVYLPYKPLSYWVCHISSFVLLAVGMAATSIPVLGCIRDGRIQQGEGIVFDHFYLTHLHELWTLREQINHVTGKKKKNTKDEISSTTNDNLDVCVDKL
ncbi:hypothetical protein Bpfe_003047 [Biomphalaria pfeifferi]|uniref:Uncharacterized protein n=1 Tax=Biomphalaria pfeifferi TaxID=112525 RepID=A0AAD8C740_BIOPF|nr:hypothetical protein Bpfe_003047 [Biomphalaria pfeifferi]